MLKKLAEIEKINENKSNELQEKLYANLLKIIEREARLGKKSTYYQVPVFIPGFSVFDITKTINYIYNNLLKENFAVAKMQFNYLYISWDTSIAEASKYDPNIEQMDDSYFLVKSIINKDKLN